MSPSVWPRPWYCSTRSPRSPPRSIVSRSARTSRVCSFSAVSAEEANGLPTVAVLSANKRFNYLRTVEPSGHERQSESVADPVLGPGGPRQLRQHGVEDLQLLGGEQRGPFGLPLVVDP